MDRTTIVLESVEDYYDIINGVKKEFDFTVKTKTTNGMLLADKKGNQDIKVTGRIDDDEETTTIAIECADKNTAENIIHWVHDNYS